jgi:Ca2+-binding RTX toxin-like protein
VVARLAGPLAPGQFAQTEASADVAIGRVTALDGTAVATRVDGTRVTLALDSPIQQGDVLETGDGSALGVVFVDNTSFSLGANARMVVDELVYDPSGGTGQAAFSVVQGLFVFVSGEVAHGDPDAMTLSTPVATIGIRGTGLGIQAAAEGLRNLISLIVDPLGGLGNVVITNGGGTTVLDEVNETTTITSFNDAPSTPYILSETQVQALFQAPLNLSPFGGALQDVGGDTEGDEDQQGEGETEGSDDGATNVTNAGGEDDPFNVDVGFLSGLLGPNPLLDALNKLYVPQLSDDSGGLDGEDRLNQGDQEVLDFALAAGGGGRLGIGTDGDDILDAVAFGNQNIANLLVGFGGNDTITGGDLNDFMFGNNGNDSLIGGTGLGNDIIDGGDDTDTLIYSSATLPVNVNLLNGQAFGTFGVFNGILQRETGIDDISGIENVIGGQAGDFIFGDSNANVLDGAGGNDSIDGGDGDDNLVGGEGTDILDGEVGEDVLDGGAGDDSLIGGAGNDILDGGAGIDTADYSNNANLIVADLRDGSVQGGSVDTLVSIERIIGSAHDDTIFGSDGDDTINGAGGDDVMDGRGGFDFVDFSSSGAPVVIELGTGNATGQGTDTVLDFEGVIGSTGNDTITGDSANNVLRGNNGNDVLDGRDGDDELDGGFGTDTADFGNGGAVNVNLANGTATGQGNDTLISIENVTGSAQGDTIVGDAFTNSLLGGDGNDDILGGGGGDFIGGENNNDVIDGEAGFDILHGDAGNDVVRGGADGDGVFGEGGDDSLFGDAGNDSLDDGAGVDELDGGADNDTLSVSADGTDLDTFDGGAGTDTLDLSQASAATTVDLSAGTIDGGGFVATVSGHR